MLASQEEICFMELVSASLKGKSTPDPNLNVNISSLASAVISYFLSIYAFLCNSRNIVHRGLFPWLRKRGIGNRG
jgi:hypothetical protein